jgi:D-alanyl-D-alanine carboxypeptidase (penicillin-binding protein 5/6)
MEKDTGQIIYAHNEEEEMLPASVTKLMTLLLIMERIDNGSL